MAEHQTEQASRPSRISHPLQDDVQGKRWSRAGTFRVRRGTLEDNVSAEMTLQWDRARPLVLVTFEGRLPGDGVPEPADEPYETQIDGRWHVMTVIRSEYTSRNGGQHKRVCELISEMDVAKNETVTAIRFLLPGWISAFDRPRGEYPKRLRVDAQLPGEWTLAVSELPRPECWPECGAAFFGYSCELYRTDYGTFSVGDAAVLFESLHWALLLCAGCDVQPCLPIAVAEGSGLAPMLWYSMNAEWGKRQPVWTCEVSDQWQSVLAGLVSLSAEERRGTQEVIWLWNAARSSPARPAADAVLVGTALESAMSLLVAVKRPTENAKSWDKKKQLHEKIADTLAFLNVPDDLAFANKFGWALITNAGSPFSTASDAISSLRNAHAHHGPIRRAERQAWSDDQIKGSCRLAEYLVEICVLKTLGK